MSDDAVCLIALMIGGAALFAWTWFVGRLFHHEDLKR